MDIKTLWFSPKGRASRSDLWLRTYLPIAGMSVIASMFDGPAGHYWDIFWIMILLAVSWAFLAVQIKRCHDRNRSGWFLLLGLVPLLNLWPSIEIWFLKGTTGTNRFGEDPIAD
jgi:uncharacterized membrane protein YhaH (DUF805 family)